MINIVGLGPGHIDYILPIAIKTIKSSTMVIGAKRNLENVSEYLTESIDISIGLNKIADYLIEHKEDEISVVVSGDTGFYSLLKFVQRYIGDEYLNVLPGISSFQYLYSKLKSGYESSRLISLHGREQDFKSLIKDKIEIGILTDSRQNNRFIAKEIILLGKQGLDTNGITLTVGERLSYPDEKITVMSLNEAVKYKAEDLSVVVVRYE